MANQKAQSSVWRGITPTWTLSHREKNGDSGSNAHPHKLFFSCGKALQTLGRMQTAPWLNTVNADAPKMKVPIHHWKLMFPVMDWHKLFPARFMSPFALIAKNEKSFLCWWS